MPNQVNKQSNSFSFFDTHASYSPSLDALRSSIPPVSAKIVKEYPTNQRISRGPLPTSCMICTEEFGKDIIPPPWVSLACQHSPSVCFACMQKCIRSDLESKIWNQIKCPECKILLIYEDIKRLADPETFTR